MGMGIFRHTLSEPGMWRGWLESGQCVEIAWDKRGWDFGGGVHIHSNDEDKGDRMLFLELWRLTVVLPLGVIDHHWPVGDEPQWSAYVSQEFGLWLRWGQWSKSWGLPWHWHTLAYEQQMPDGTWLSVFSRYTDEGVRQEPYSEVYPYTYVLRSGAVQSRVATVSKRRHILTWLAFKRIGWPRWIKESIDIEFDDEVGERSGSWKGGCIGCSYDMLPGETMEMTLRRMEGERKF